MKLGIIVGVAPVLPPRPLATLIVVTMQNNPGEACRADRS
jgi:hypothetical protein